MLVQFLARFFLLVFNLTGWIRLAFAVDIYKEKRGRNIGAWLLLITACQFHIPFYSSRVLPNTFALAVILQAYSLWFQERIESAAACIVFATAIFRCDVLLLLGTVGLSWLILRQLTIAKALRTGILTGLLSLVVTVPIDSLLWQRFLWPEGEVFYFNTILGKSSDWGTSPWYWYFSSALPKSMLLTLLLVPFAFLRLPEVLATWEERIRQSSSNGGNAGHLLRFFDSEWLPFLVPILGFVATYSNLGHKEMRFIFPAIPILNVAAAVSMGRITRLAFPQKDKRPMIISRLMFFGGVMCLALTMAGSLAFLAVSKWNYPGGEALLRLSEHVQNQAKSVKLIHAQLHVHIDVASAMSGVSLFTQRAAQSVSRSVQWSFDKGGYETENALVEDYGRFTHILCETTMDIPNFVVVDIIPGSPRLDIKRLRIDTSPSILILEKDSFWQDMNESIS